MLSISVKGIDNAGETFSGKVSPEALGLNDAPSDENILFETPVEYTLHVSEVSGGILVAGTISTKLTVSCCKCLEQFELRCPRAVDRFVLLGGPQQVGVGVAAVQVANGEKPVHVVYTGGGIAQVLVAAAEPAGHVADAVLDIVAQSQHADARTGPVHDAGQHGHWIHIVEHVKNVIDLVLKKFF